jgi:isoleucyl-tRNA synthetase
LLQEARKARGFEVTDRIELAWQAEGELAEALREHGRTVAAEVLATTVHENLSALAGEPDHTATDLGLTFRLRRVAD